MITDEKQREFWTVENLSKLSHQRLERVTRRLSNTLALTRILLGRCLLAIERTEGLSGNNSCIRGADPSPVAALPFPYILPYARSDAPCHRGASTPGMRLLIPDRP